MNGVNRTRGRLLNTINLLADVFAGFSRLVGQVFNFRSHNRKALTGFTCPRHFNGRIQRQQVSLTGNVVDQIDHFTDFSRCIRQALNGFVGALGLLDRVSSDFGLLGDLAGNLGDGTTQFLESGGHGLHIGGRFFRRRGDRT